MKRRQFLAHSAAAATWLGLSSTGVASAAEVSADKRQEYYEWRAYRLKSKADQTLLDRYLAEAAIPGLNRLGIKPVGVFVETQPKDEPTVFVLLAYETAEAVATTAARLKP